MSIDQVFSHDNRSPGMIAKKKGAEVRKEVRAVELNKLTRRKTDLELQLQDLINEFDAFTVQAASAKAALAAGKPADPDYKSLKNGKKVATDKAKHLKKAISAKTAEFNDAKADIADNVANLKKAIDSELGNGGRLEIKGIIEGALNDAMALCGSLKDQLLQFEKYGDGICDKAGSEIDAAHVAVESIWREVQKV